MYWYRDRETLEREVALHGSVAAAARANGTSRATVNHWASKLGVRSGHPKTPGPRTVEPAPIPTDAGVIVRELDPVEVQTLRRQLERKEAELKSLRVEVKHSAKHANLLDDVRDLLAPAVAGCVLPKPRIPKPERPKKHSGVTLVLHLTDLHWGEIVDPITVNGMNAYSPGIAARRVQHAIDTTRAWIDNYAELEGIERVVVVVNGDTVSGQHILHPDSAEEYARIATQVLDASLVVAQAVWEIASMVPAVTVIGTQGNHSRSTRKMPTGRARQETSWETLLHEMVAALLARAENVRFHIATGYTVAATIGPSTWAFAHGDALGGGGGNLGIPAYSLKRQHDANREWSVILASMEETATRGIVKHTRCGHFHTFFKWQAGQGDIALCPSPKGVDSFVKDRLGRYSPAAVLLEAVHPRLDVIGTHEIGLQHVMDESEPCRYTWGALNDGAPRSETMREWIDARR